jgi:hypothetical protein
MTLIREYIKTQIRKIDAQLLEHEADNLPATRLESAYTVSFGDVSSSNEANHFADTHPVEIKLFRRCDKLRSMTYDQCVDLVRRIRGVMVNPMNYSDRPISSIGSGSFAVSEYSQNKDIYELRLSLDFVVNSAL